MAPHHFSTGGDGEFFYANWFVMNYIIIVSWWNAALPPEGWYGSSSSESGMGSFFMMAIRKINYINNVFPVLSSSTTVYVFNVGSPSSSNRDGEFFYYNVFSFHALLEVFNVSNPSDHPSFLQLVLTSPVFTESVNCLWPHWNFKSQETAAQDKDGY